LNKKEKGKRKKVKVKSEKEKLFIDIRRSPRVPLLLRKKVKKSSI